MRLEGILNGNSNPPAQNCRVSRFSLVRTLAKTPLVEDFQSVAHEQRSILGKETRFFKELQQR